MENSTILEAIEDVINIIEKYDKKELSTDEKAQERLLEEVNKTLKSRGISKEDFVKFLELINEYIVMFDNKQQGFKKGANSIYGIFGDKTSRYYFPFVAGAITSTGAVLSKSVQDYINDELGIPVLYGDTDSIYLTLNDIIPEEVKKSGDDSVRSFIYDYIQKELYPKIKGYIDKKVYEWFNITEHVFEFKQEIIAKRGLFLKSKSGDKEVKKRYVLYIIDKEGAKKDELFIVGIDIKRSEYPKIIRERHMQFLEKLMKDNNLDINLILELKKDVIKWCKEKNLENICINKGFSKKLEEYSQKTYMEEGAMLYNDVISEMFNLSKIAEGTKTMAIFVKSFKKITKENPISEKLKSEYINLWNEYITKNRTKLKVIIIPHDVYNLIPREFFDLIEIDINETVNRLVIEPIKSILITLNIDIEKVLIEGSISKMF